MIDIITPATLVEIADHANGYPYVTAGLEDAITLFCNQRNIDAPDTDSKTTAYAFIDTIRPLAV